MISCLVYFCLGYDLLVTMADSWAMSFFLHRTECRDYCYTVTFP